MFPKKVLKVSMRMGKQMYYGDSVQVDTVRCNVSHLNIESVKNPESKVQRSYSAKNDLYDLFYSLDVLLTQYHYTIFKYLYVVWVKVFPKLDL